MFPVGPDPPADALGAHIARGTAGRHGAVSHRFLGNRAGSRQVSEQPIRTRSSVCVVATVTVRPLSAPSVL